MSFLKNLFNKNKLPEPDKKWAKPVDIKGEDLSDQSKKYIILVKPNKESQYCIHGFANSVDEAKDYVSKSEIMLIHRSESKRIKNILKKYKYPKVEILAIDTELCWTNNKT